MTYDASSRKDIRKAEKAQALADANRIAYTRQIMAEPFGRAWMHNVLLRCHVFHTSFVRGAPDVTAFREGERNIGQQIFADVVTYCPNQYVLMMQETSQKEAANERRDSNKRPASGEQPGGEDAGWDPEGPIADPADADGAAEEE